METIIYPTYEELMEQINKPAEEASFRCYNRDCDMLLFKDKGYYAKGQILVNTRTKKVMPIVQPDGKIVGFTSDDIDWERVSDLHNNHNAYNLEANYSFSIGMFKGGMAEVEWMLYPDGQYFADSDGFGAETCDEVCIYGVIDVNGHVVKKFSPEETNTERRERLQREKLAALHKHYQIQNDFVHQNMEQTEVLCRRIVQDILMRLNRLDDQEVSRRRSEGRGLWSMWMVCKGELKLMGSIVFLNNNEVNFSMCFLGHSFYGSRGVSVVRLANVDLLKAWLADTDTATAASMKCLLDLTSTYEQDL